MESISNWKKKLQLVQNAAARLVTQVKRTDHITPIRMQLHWLPIAQRIEYKILLLTYKALHGKAPLYLSELLEPCTSTRNGMNLTLKVPKMKSVKYGDRAFKKAGPKLWNTLPQEIRKSTKLNDFKRQLKTHLFNKAYGSSS